jgi:hypothetical protein
MVKKILVTGFPHSGTTILRAKIGECKNTYDCNYECVDPPNFYPAMQYDFYVWKHPFLDAPFRNHTFAIKPESKYADTIVIPIIRNPWHIFSSLHMRGTQSNEFSIYDNRQGHSLPWYENTCEVIFDAFQKNYKDVYPIKYEEMFDNNFEKLRNIFDSIGLEYDADIFEKRTKEFSHGDAKYVEDYNKNGKYDGGLRVWQINQPFQNMNADINLPDDFSQMLANSPSIQKLGYSDPRITH